MKRAIVKKTGLGLGAALLSLGVYLGGLQLTGNFHEVLPGQLYRSAQPTPAALAEYNGRYGIRTVINLRGSSDAEWYRDEVATSRKLGLTHIDFRMSANKPLSVKRTHELAAILRDAPKPVLIHCQSGSDRTGLASVIYLQQVAGVAQETAEKQLSILFGHIGIRYLSGTIAMEDSWERFEKSLTIPAQAMTLAAL